MAPKYAALPTRERILAYLEEHHTASVQALSRAWRLTPADIRYHLAALVKDGLIEQVPRDLSQPARRGRPAQHYRLPTTAIPDNLPALCSVLLRVMRATAPPDQHGSFLRESARLMAGAVQPCPPPSASPVQRLNGSVDFLTRHGYRARWEAGPGGPRVLLRACPYAAILDQHPELCQFDRFLLESLANLPLAQTTRINPLTGSPPACIFTTPTHSETARETKERFDS